MLWILHVDEGSKEKDVLAGDEVQSFAFCMHERESNKQFHGVLGNDNKAQFLQKVGATLSSLVGASFEIRPTAYGSMAHRKNNPQKI